MKKAIGFGLLMLAYTLVFSYVYKLQGDLNPLKSLAMLSVFFFSIPLIEEMYTALTKNIKKQKKDCKCQQI